MSNEHKARKRKYPEIQPVRATAQDAASTQSVMRRLMGRAPLERQTEEELPAPPTIEAPPKSVAPPKRSGYPLQSEPAPKTGVPPKIAAPSIFVLPARTPHTRVPNEIFDRVMPTLEPAQQVILWRLYRLSAGFDSLRCRVSLPKLSAMIHVKPTQLRAHLKVLEERGYVKRISVDLANKNQQERGIEFEVRLPRLALSETAAPPKTAAASITEAPSVIEPNKELLKNTHTNAGDVRVRSRFSLAECRKYAESLRADGITNPGGYATKIHRSGEADDLITAFLSPAEAAPMQDVSQCPDCHGTGFWEPGGAGKGVAKCRHENLHIKRSDMEQGS